MEGPDWAPALSAALDGVKIPVRLRPDRLDWVEERAGECAGRTEKRPVDVEAAMRILKSTSPK